MHLAAAALDLAIVVLATLRLSRLVMTDALGQRYIIGPAYLWSRSSPRRAFVAGGLTCPFCIGHWLGVGVLVITLLTAPLGHLPLWWHLVFGSLAVNYVVGHVASRMGDTDLNSPL